ncbi:hypothetical protein Deipr_2725 (plasmid) [Deinococcus proteolyticus MRP]|uniref:Uncharacterized protein n=1 Tax=Deinococcus proteolyticus (strain ATCC 35074 / DSM 20540 / JCM 6276 / NBRC 101906 / NCIMB 13154 / VKM Ac-1939 / CCM 2703 / MRP) TaxID=693977 RepID=F0RRB2_DEIPM|nr:hypothetical protein [Deinococcus proteolyticus]ADY27821.1 hypothetical protein Deipr_2725 [Deinococcus proteolyticus MRP]
MSGKIYDLRFEKGSFIDLYHHEPKQRAQARLGYYIAAVTHTDVYHGADDTEPNDLNMRATPFIALKLFYVSKQQNLLSEKLKGLKITSVRKLYQALEEKQGTLNTEQLTVLEQLGDLNAEFANYHLVTTLSMPRIITTDNELSSLFTVLRRLERTGNHLLKKEKQRHEQAKRLAKRP